MQAGVDPVTLLRAPIEHGLMPACAKSLPVPPRLHPGRVARFTILSRPPLA
ncbi:uncharacterized protein FIBRA_06658 [Fibroporia radiculosa]|uniref:Uncharacterized protein n=1 Tax=Fibroporia radiculosa TaxID=599839 RepID=J4GC53_9APHY|nr:uncharacterized protein FIBRA_06658 [Fibroporia radiculosa]CCM04478.1 predicted protein [Fibroporia radiculosa]